MDGIIAYINKGGFFIYPIILGTLWAMILFFERLLFYFSTATNLSKQSKTFFSLLTEEGGERVQEYLITQKGLLKTILLTAVNNLDQPPLRIEEKMEAVILKELPAYSKRLNFLASLAGIMPILGLLGTVTGMIATFKVIALQGTGDAQAMADGISEALITTQAGLVAALPIILGHVLLTNRLKTISDKTKETCTLFLDYIKDNYAQ